MRDFLVLLSKDCKILINYIKAIRNNPKRLLILALYIGYFGFLLWANLSTNRTGVSTFSPALVSGMIIGYGGMILLSNLLSGYNEMITFFKPADVNTVFNSPISPRIVMAAGLVKSSFGNILLTLFLVILGGKGLIPKGAHISSLLGVVIIVLSFNFVAQPMNFILLRLKKHVPRMLVHIVINGLWFFPLLVLLVVNHFELVPWLTDSRIYYIPLLGWMAGLALACYGVMVPLWPMLLMFYVVFITGVIGLCLYLSDDYYEDVCGGIEKFATLRQRGKEGKGRIAKVRKKIRQSSSDESSDMHSQINNAWYWKSIIMAEKRRRFPLIGTLEGIMVLGAIGVAIATYVIDWEVALMPYIYNGLVLYIVFLFSVNNSQKMDFLTPKFLMSPGNPLNKLVSVVRLDFLKHLVAMIMINVVLAFSKEVELTFLALCFVTQIIFYLEIMSSNLLVSIFLKNSTDVALMLPLLKVIQMLILIGPSFGIIFLVVKFTEDVTSILTLVGLGHVAIVAFLMGLSAWQATRLEINQ